MKKFLTILWIVILAGVIFISIQLFKPKTSIEKDIENYESLKPEIITKEEEIALEADAPKTYTENLTAGDKYFLKGELQSAIASYDRASKLNPNSTEPLIKLGNAYLINNDPQKAEEAFKKAEESDPNSIQIKIGIARSYINARNIEKAKSLVWQLDKTDYTVQYYTALILILYKDFEGAENIFQDLVAAESASEREEGTEIPQIDPLLVENSQKFLDKYTTFSYFKGGETLHLQTLLAKTFTEVYEYEAVIPLLYDIINQKNNYRDAWIILGYAYLNTDKTPDAIDAFTQAKSLDEEKPETLFFLGLAYFANNEIDKAIFYLEEADKNDFEPKDQIDLKLGDLYLLKEKYSQSSQKYEEVLSVNTNNIDVFVRAIWLNIDKLNNPQKALKLAYQAMEAHPGEAMGYNLVGWSLTSLGNYQEAKKYLAKALEINPDFDAAILNLGWLYEKQNLVTLAKEYYKRAYILGEENAIANLAAVRFNKLTEKELQNYYYQVDISSPTSP